MSVEGWPIGVTTAVTAHLLRLTKAFAYLSRNLFYLFYNEV